MPEEDNISQIAKEEYNTEKRYHIFDSESLINGQIIPDIVLIDSNCEEREKLENLIKKLEFNIISYSKANEALKYIKKQYPDLILIDTNSEFDTEKILDEILHLNIPSILLIDLNNDEVDDTLLDLCHNIIFKPYTQREVEQNIIVSLIEYSENYNRIIAAEDNISEKNEELVIEKIGAFLLIFISVVLIVSGLLAFNMTFLQWLVFIPSVIMIVVAIISLKSTDEIKPFEIPPFVSIIIPAHNEEFTIEDTIRSITAMDYKLDGKDNYEIIVCNDGSTDNTGEILNNLKEEFPQLRIVTRIPPQSGKGKGFVLNDALHISNGDIIGVFDADTRVKPDYLQKVIPYLNNDEVHGVQSRVKMYNKDENFLARMQHVEFASFGNTLRAKDIMSYNGFLGGNGQFVKKEAIIESGYWDGFAVTEDLNLSIKLLLKKKGIRYCPDAAVYQEAITDWKSLFRQRTRWAMGNFETLFIYFPKILRAPLSTLKKIGMVEHISFYAFNLFIFTGFIVFIINAIAWFVFHQPTVIRMEAPLIVGIISAFAFFPPQIISLTRDKTNVLSFLKDLFGYWIYCYHLIPLFFQTMWTMIIRNERSWSKTKHVKKAGEISIDE